MSRALHRARRLTSAAALSLLSCASSASELPYGAWYMGFFAPPYMEAWIEDVRVVDIDGRMDTGAGGGLVAVDTPEGGSADPRGWPAPEQIGLGAGRHIEGANLPRRIFVRWQSMAEPNTYRVWLEIPEEARQLMIRRERPLTSSGPLTYRSDLVIGLAPGGKVRVWSKGAGLPGIEILHTQGELEPLGPYGGQSGGRHRPLRESSMRYIKRHGIPYDSW